MSTLSLPGYSADNLQTTSYNTEPIICEPRHRGQLPPLAVATPTVRPPVSEFVKESKGLRLRLYRQGINATVPVFGIRGPVEGMLEVTKPKGLIFIGVRVGVSIICALAFEIWIWIFEN
jgi:hypothetical protein